MCGIHTLARHLSCFMEHAANRRLFRSEASGDTLASSGDTRFSACAFRNFRGDKPPEAAPDGASPSEQRSSCGRECSRRGCCRASSSRRRHRLPRASGICSSSSSLSYDAAATTAPAGHRPRNGGSATRPRRCPLAAARPPYPRRHRLPPLALAAASLSPPPPRSRRRHLALAATTYPHAQVRRRLPPNEKVRKMAISRFALASRVRPSMSRVPTLTHSSDQCPAVASWQRRPGAAPGGLTSPSPVLQAAGSALAWARVSEGRGARVRACGAAGP